MDRRPDGPAMDAKRAVKWALGYRAAATLSFVVGLGIAGLGTWVWIVGPLLEALVGPSTVTTALLVDAAPGLVCIVLGVLVWQTGSTVGLYYTLVSATGTESAESVDTEKIKSDVLAVLDERLAEMHEDVEATRRAVGADPADRAVGSRGATTADGHGRGDDAPNDGPPDASDESRADAGHPAAPDDRNGSGP